MTTTAQAPETTARAAENTAHDSENPARATEPVSSAAAESRLGERDLAILDFERQWWRYAGSKDEAIRAKFDLNTTRYFQLLNALLDNPDALAHDPLLVKRLRRLRDSRQKARAARSAGKRLG